LVATLAAFTVLLLVLFPSWQVRDYDRERFGFPEGETIRFTPRPDGGFGVESLPLEAAPDPAALGERLDMWSGGRTAHGMSYARVEAGFAFPFGGVAYDTLYVADSPLVTLGEAPLSWDVPHNQFFAGPQPKLAPLLFWVQTPEEDAAFAGGVYVRREPGRLTITWADVWCCTTSERNTVQLTLSADGAYAFHYPHLGTGIHNTRGMRTLIGVHPGRDAPL